MSHTGLLRASAVALIVAALSAPLPLHAGALVELAKDGNVAAALALIDDGADVSARGHAGETALHWAAFNGHLDLAERLIARGAPINAQVKNGNTPLHQAAYAGRLEIARLLLASGAKVNALDARGATPAGWAERNGHSQLVELLREHGGRVAIGSNARRPGDPDSLSAQRVDPRYNAGLSRRMGELPSLVMRVPDNVASAAPALSLSRDIRSVPQKPATVPDAPTPRASRGDAEDAPRAWLQLGAFRREQDAGVHREQLLSRHRDLLGDRPLEVVVADVEGRGRFHRVRTGPLVVSRARRTCSALKARGAPCLLVLGKR